MYMCHATPYVAHAARCNGALLYIIYWYNQQLSKQQKSPHIAALLACQDMYERNTHTQVYLQTFTNIFIYSHIILYIHMYM